MIVWWILLGFMHQPDEPKSLSYWEEVGNPLILHNAPTHMQPEQIANVEIKKGAEDLKMPLPRLPLPRLELKTSGFDYHVRFHAPTR